MNRAVIYARFSCSKQREASIEDQLRVCRSWAETNGYEVVAEYCDYAISGRTDERPQFQRMIDNAGESECVIVYMMDRFSRDPYDAPIYKKKLRDRGVRVVSATEAIPEGAEAVLIEKLYEGLAAVESAHIAERTKRGMYGNALKCRPNGVKVYGYDMTTEEYTINEEQAAIVREVFARHCQGEPSSAIARDLAARGVVTYAGNPVGYTFVNNMLRNEKYMGVYTWSDIRVEGGMPRIIEPDEWRRAQSVKPRKQRHREEWREFPLAGKCICAGCGMNFNGSSAHGHGGRYNYYTCRNRCGVKPVRAEWLEDTIAAALREMLSSRESALEVAHMVERAVTGEKSEANVRAAEKRLHDAQKVRRNIAQAVAQGMPYEDVREELERAKAQEEASRRELELLETTERFSADDFADFLQFGATLDDAALLDAFVYQVMVSEDDITVSMNYDTEKLEPARLSISRVRAISVWLPKAQTRRTLLVAVDAGQVLIRLARAA